MLAARIQQVKNFEEIGSELCIFHRFKPNTHTSTERMLYVLNENYLASLLKHMK